MKRLDYEVRKINKWWLWSEVFTGSVSRVVKVEANTFRTEKTDYHLLSRDLSVLVEIEPLERTNRPEEYFWLDNKCNNIYNNVY